MKAKDLKNSILQMAVEGKLVPQDPNDEPANVLLERIREEKHRLIAEGKAKFPKGGESIIYTASDGSPYEKRVDAKGRVLSDEGIADEVPFELPEGWCWARFETALLNRDAERIPVSVSDREKLEKKYDYYGASGVIDRIDRYLFDKPLLLISEDGANLLIRSKPVAFVAHGKYWVNNHAHVLDGPGEPYLEYIALFINSISLSPYVTGTAQPKMNQSRMGKILIAIPPAAEQSRILGRVSELMPLIDAYGELEGAREELDAALPGRLRRSVLQEAVRGRLAPQDPSDEPAGELLARIRAERRRLAAEGKVKLPRGGDSVIFTGSDGRRYEKRVDARGRESEPACIEGEIPFEIPEGWAWARFTQIVPVQYGFAADSSKFVTDGSVGLIRIRDVNSGDLVHTTVNYSGEWSEEYLIRSGDDLVGMDGEFTCKRWKGPDALLNQRVCCFRYLSETVNRDFISYVINWYLDRIWKQTSKTTVKHLSAKALDNLLFAVPPLEEQKRIINRARALLDALE